MMPNATSILSTLPNGLRAEVSRDDGAVASLAIRTALRDSGQLSLGGMDSDLRTAVWTLASDFKTPIRVGDVLMVDKVPAIVVDVLTTCGNLVCRSQVLLCEDTVTINDVDIACSIGLLDQSVDPGLGGFLPEDMQGLFIPESLLPEGVTITQSTVVTFHGEDLVVEKVSRSPDHSILCVTCKRRGDE